MRSNTLQAITGDNFAITALAGCGDEFIAESLNQLGIDWEATALASKQWSDDRRHVMCVLREPVSWYHSYILDVSEGKGEHREIDEEISGVFTHLGNEPRVAVNVAAVNMCAQHPGWLGVQYKICELSLLDCSAALVGYQDLASVLPDFLEKSGHRGLAVDRMPSISEYEHGEHAPEFFPQTIESIRREERNTYRQFSRLLRWDTFQ